MSDPIDIVERLRRRPAHTPHDQALLADAAAEITRLRADFAALQHALVGDTGASAILTAQRLRAALAQPAAVSANAEDWLRERFGVVRGHPEWRALAEAFDAGKALAQPAAPVWQPIETAPDGVMLLFADMNAAEARHWVFCGWRHSGLRGDSVQMPDNTTRSATHWMPLPAAPQAPRPGAQGA